MKSILKIALGIIAALGGFLDIGDLVFNTQAGALYRYDLLWAVALGTLGIAVYAEMCGRVAAVTQRPVFDVIRMRLGFGLGLVALVASTIVNLLTVAAELGGLAIILKLLFDAAFSIFVVARRDRARRRRRAAPLRRHRADLRLLRADDARLRRHRDPPGPGLGRRRRTASSPPSAARPSTSTSSSASSPRR